jgi:hypothetical protein
MSKLATDIASEAHAESIHIPIGNDMTLRCWYNYPPNGLHMEVQIGFGEDAYTTEPLVLDMKNLRFLARMMEDYAQAGGQ